MIIRNSNLRTMLFDNRYKVLVVIIAIILILIIVPNLNEMVKEESQREYANRLNTVNEEKSTTYTPEKTVISGDNVSKNQQEDNEELLDKFVQACNEGKIQQAYDMLTNECKKEVFFSNIEYFEKNYIDRIFNEQKTFSMQSWVKKDSYTYQVKFTSDMLSSGKIDNNVITDYITVVKTTDGYKLNINEYIKEEKINSSNEKNNIQILVNKREIYKDYEIYEIEIKNNSEKTILLDSKQTNDSVYIQNEISSTYPAFMYEVDDTKLIIEPKKTKTIEIKFNKIYSNTKRITSLVFENIVRDYEEYINTQNKEEYENTMKVIVQL